MTVREKMKNEDLRRNNEKRGKKKGRKLHQKGVKRPKLASLELYTLKNKSQKWGGMIKMHNIYPWLPTKFF